jgi:hypothetical protein
MTVPLKALDNILAGVERVHRDVDAVLNTAGDMPIGQLLDLRDTLDLRNDALLTTLRTILALYAADPTNPNATERAAANAGITAYISGRVPPPDPTNAIALLAGIRQEIIAVMDAIETSGDAGLNGVNGGVERVLGAGGRYEPLTVTKVQRSALDGALTTLRATLAPLI